MSPKSFGNWYCLHAASNRGDVLSLRVVAQDELDRDYAWSIPSAVTPVGDFDAAYFTLDSGAFAACNGIGQGVFSLEANENELFLV